MRMLTLALPLGLALCVGVGMAAALAPADPPAGGESDPPPAPELEPPSGEPLVPPWRPAATSAGTTTVAAECAAGCAALPAAGPELPTERFRQLLEEYGFQPRSAESPALEELLFHGPRTRALLDAHGSWPLGRAHLELLESELERTHAWLEVRLLDADGVERMRLDPAPFELGVRRHVHADQLARLQPVEVSGTVRRVGLHHLWTRF